MGKIGDIVFGLILLSVSAAFISFFLCLAAFLLDVTLHLSIFN